MKDDLISRSALLTAIKENPCWTYNSQSDARDIVQAAPAVDAVEVVPGRWLKSIDNECEMHKCSVCGARVVKGPYEYENPNRYCYHCGAKMDGGKDNGYFQNGNSN